MNSNFDEVQQKVKCSLNKLMDFDHFLLEKNVNERSITHKLAEYLQMEFKNWNVDCEYNKMVNGEFIDPKRMMFTVEDVESNDTDAKTIFPDIIIHKRKSKDNLLVVEVKKSINNQNRLKDERKLETFTKSDHFKYSFGLNIILPVKNDFGKPSCLKWYVNGEICHEELY